MNNLSSIWRNFLLDAIFTWNHFMYLLTKFKIHLDTITNKANYTRKIQSYTLFTDIPPITHVKNATETTAQIDWKRGARSRTFETWRTFQKLRQIGLTSTFLRLNTSKFTWKIYVHILWYILVFAQCGNFIFFQHSVLREINFEDSTSAKSAILTHLQALNFDIYEFLHFLKAAIWFFTKIQSP